MINEMKRPAIIFHGSLQLSASNMMRLDNIDFCTCESGLQCIFFQIKLEWSQSDKLKWSSFLRGIKEGHSLVEMLVIIFWFEQWGNITGMTRYCWIGEKLWIRYTTLWLLASISQFSKRFSLKNRHNNHPEMLTKQYYASLSDTKANKV